ncbi:MAG: T9SS type A sorting domain-containing protein [Candidatus Latescibacteria bacterium]|nr:T9SS type A sorting domain-containing protein [Candidatus Latescibacterota bacterium]
MRSRTTFLGVVFVLAASLCPDHAFAATIRALETPQPSIGSGVVTDTFVPIAIPALPAPFAEPKPNPDAPPLLGPAIECFNYDTNTATAGIRLVPPDPHCAAGPDHVIVIGNVTIEWRPRAGIADLPQYQASLKSFFSGLPGPPAGPGTTLGTNCFDPKVIYDQYAGRFVVVALERTDTPNPSESRILVGVSKTSDPNDGWWLHSIDSKVNMGGLDRWADYPGLGVDDKAVYITNNMFAFSAGGSVYGGTRLWILRKTNAYAGPNNNYFAAVYDPFTDPNSVPTTAQPAHMFGPPGVGSAGRPLGTFLTSFSGLTDGTDDFIQVIEVTDPYTTVGGPFFTLQFINFGDLDGGVGMPDAPQLGLPAYPIETNDRRALNAVWRAGNLYTCAQIVPLGVVVDAGQATAHWWRVDTSTPAPGLVLADQGDVGGEDLGGSTHTFFPSVMVDCDLNMAIGFAASNAGIYCGAYYATRMATDPPGTIGFTWALKSGEAPYKRFHSGNRNRWGDYSGLALCPAGEAEFFVFNEYAGPVGTPGTGFNGPEDGRWFTKLGWFRLKEATPVADAPATGTRLAQNVPNPFNPTTTIPFSLAARGPATVSVFDTSGRLVRTLVDETRAAGDHVVRWDGRDARGRSVASGVYFYRLVAGSVTESKKMVLLK